MDTRVLNANEVNINIAAQVIRDGGLVAFPTETVYGLGANALDPSSVRKIFAAKNRPADNPLIVHVASFSDVYALADEVPDAARLLAEKFMPGPLTLVLPCSSIVPDAVTAGGDTVAVRIPAHPVARALIQAAGVPIAAPSANTAGTPSPTRAEHVLSDLHNKVDIILDGGACGVGLESTVVSLTGVPRLLRPGGVTLEQLREVLGTVEVDRALFETVGDGEMVSSPGMKYRHYAPKAEVVVVCGGAIDTAKYIFMNLPDSKRIGIICFSEFAEMFPQQQTIAFGDSDDSEMQARNLFDALRRMDAQGVDIIFAQCPDEHGIGLAVANRLKKAAGFSIIEA